MTSPSPSPVADLPVAQVTFSCRLPVIVTVLAQGGQQIDHWSGGFITFPGATYKPDPAGVITGVGDGDVGTQAQPALTGPGDDTPFYDLAQRRWLPVGPGLSSPDGSSYAYVKHDLGSPEFIAFVVTVGTGATSVKSFNPPDPGVGTAWQAADYDGRYLYLVATQVDRFPRGVWRFDPRTAGLQQLLSSTAGAILRVDNGVAWVGRVDPADPSPPNPGKGEGFDTIASVNLSTGSQTTWIYRPTELVIFWGLDSSAHPVVMVRPQPDSGADFPIVLIDVAGTDGVAIAAFFASQGAMEADTGQLWFGGPHGIYYWTQASGFIKVYDWGPNPSLQEMVAPAGHCV